MVEFACHAHCWGTWLCLPCTLLRHWVCLPCTLLRHLSVPAMHTAEALSVPAMHTAEALSVPVKHTAEALECACHAHCWGTECACHAHCWGTECACHAHCWGTCVCLTCTLLRHLIVPDIHIVEALECACHAQMLRHLCVPGMHNCWDTWVRLPCTTAETQSMSSLQRKSQGWTVPDRHWCTRHRTRSLALYTPSCSLRTRFDINRRKCTAKQLP